ncbi:hypothetical protein PTTW11_00062 [Pyrenophora teres f. teres]|uniref:Uncharacterized protein n=1 Tax=Pyrenophora teres f. teres TaxID=97479 RepID=A0A6S6VNI6_9PLEO|nr:hypothetical protein PTTW11_00062 [Pyrenophora teres f. teres]
MSEGAMATSSKTPSAQKGKVNSSPSSKGTAKVQQVPRSSPSQTTTQTPQRRRTLASQTTPKKAAQQRRKTSAVDSAPVPMNKRKLSDIGPSPQQTLPTMRKSGTSMSIPMIPPHKKQKSRNDTSSEILIPSLPSIPLSLQLIPTKLPVPLPPPSPSPSPSPPTRRPPSQVPIHTTPTNPVPINLVLPNNPPNNPFIQLLHHVLQHNPALLPITEPPNVPTLTSPHIDRIAHAMWDLAFRNGHVFHMACQYSAMFSPFKLRILAKINFLPSWWFLREIVIKGGVEGKLERSAKRDVGTMTVERGEGFEAEGLQGYDGGECMEE